MIERTTPPPVESADATTTPTTPSATTPASTPERFPRDAVRPAERRAGPDPTRTDALVSDLRQMRVDQLFALSGGPRLHGVLTESEGAPVNLEELALRSEGVHDGPDPLGLPSGVGAPVPTHGALQDLATGAPVAVATTAGTARPVVPMPILQGDPPVLSTPVANAEAVLRKELYPRARRCYQKGLDVNPTQTGKIRAQHPGRAQRRGLVGRHRGAREPLERGSGLRDGRGAEAEIRTTWPHRIAAARGDGLPARRVTPRVTALSDAARVDSTEQAQQPVEDRHGCGGQPGTYRSTGSDRLPRRRAPRDGRRTGRRRWRRRRRRSRSSAAGTAS